MATKFHINPDTGKAGACTASARPCKYGESTPHYKSTADAQSAYEETMSANTLTTHSRSDGTMTLERPNLTEVEELPAARIETVRKAVSGVYEFSGKLEKIAGEATDSRQVDYKEISRRIDAVVADSSFSTVESSEKVLDRLDELKNDLNRKADRLDADGEHASAASYWMASEGIADLITDNSAR